MAEGDWTAFNECRMALRRIIWKYHQVCVIGSAWNSLIPGAKPPGLSCVGGKWRSEMQEARELLKSWGYRVDPVGKTNVLLNQPLQASVQHLYNLILQNRSAGQIPAAAGDCV